MDLRLLALTYADLVREFALRYGKGPDLAAVVYREFYKRFNEKVWTADAVAASQVLAQGLRRDLVQAPGQVVDKVQRDGLVKFVTRLTDGHRIESVILPLKTHHTVCVSTQAGCRMGCAFCETAKTGLIRNLTVEEIVGQVYAARLRFGVVVRNVVFMGMGEPFDNFDAVIQAIRVISDQRGLDIAQRYITVSTAGRIDGIRRLGALGMPHLKLAVSLNAADDPLRSALMPVNKAAPLGALLQALTEFPLKKGYDIMVGYVLIPGVNDGPGRAGQLARWLAPLRAKVNLIPFNPGAGADRVPPTDDEMASFRRRLISRRVNVQERRTRGRDLMAACGQLGGPRKAPSP